MHQRELIDQAKAMRSRAYAPYSRFSVGAALLGKDGRVYTGCNVENASYGLTICAERAAFFEAIARGCREFSALAVATDDGSPPCGACLQVAREFGPDLVVLLAGAGNGARKTTLKELLPSAFSRRDLQVERDVRHRRPAEERRQVRSRRKRD